MNPRALLDSVVTRMPVSERSRMNCRHGLLPKGQLIISAVLGVAFGVARSYLASSYLHIDLTLVGCSAIAFLFFALLFLLFNLIGNTSWEPHGRPLLWVLADSASSNQMAVRVAVALLACWLPYLLLMYPGNLSNDTTGQLTMFYTLMGHGERWITAQHPVFDTLVFGAVTYPFYAIGHFRIGVFICIVLQELLTAASFGIVFAWSRRRLGISNGPLTILLGVLAFCPVVPLMVCSLSKDTFFSWVYLLWLVSFFDCIIVGEVDKCHFLALAVFGILMVLTKKFGFYVALFSFSVLTVFFVFKKKNRKALASFALVVVVGLTYGICLPLLNVATNAKPAYKSDTLIVPIQQVAMAYSRYPEDFSSEDLDVVSTFVKTEVIDSGKWVKTNTDSIKKYGDSSVAGGFTDSQISSFMAVWARIGLMHPDSYVDGWLTLEAPLFSFGKVVPLFDSLWHTWARSSVIPDQYFEKSVPFAQFSAQIRDWYNWLGTVPGVDLLLTQTLYAVLIPAYFIVSVLRRDRSLFPAVIPVIVSFLGLMVSPMVQPHFETMRYLVPFVYSIPILLCMAWVQKDATRQNDLKADKRH